jgi:hypothetical protein
MNNLLESGAPKNTTLDWYPGDTLIKFNRNNKYRPSELEKLGWKNNSILYQFDQYGFRNHNPFDQQYYNLALGCSHTFGIGVNEQDIWYNTIKQYLDEPFYNAAIAGGSIGGCYRSLQGLLNEGLQVKRVFMLTPSGVRHEHYDDDENVWKITARASLNSRSSVLMYLNNHYLKNYYNTHLMSIKYICKENNIELIDISTEGNELDGAIHKSHKGRDLEHPGVDTHKFIGEIFYDKYCKRYRSST